MVVYTGPKKTGAALIAAVAADAEKQATPRRGKKSRVAAKKPDAAAPKSEAKTEAKSDGQAGGQAGCRETRQRQAGRRRQAC